VLLALAIFVLTLVLVIAQPKGLKIGWGATIGAVLALLAGVVHVSDIPTVWGIVWNATAAFVAVIIISLLLDRAGFFEWAALHVARWAGGRGKRLFALIVLLGAAVACVFANDGAALILTPIVIAMLVQLKFSAKATLAFAMAAGFIADTASTPLVVSNLVNIVSADVFKLNFGGYALVMVPVTLVTVIATLAVLLLRFGREIPATYDLAGLKRPNEAIRDPSVFVTGWVVLAALLVGFFALQPLGVPVSAVAAAGAVALLLVAARGRVVSPVAVLGEAPWQVVIFSLGMYLVVFGLRNAGLTGYLSTLFERFALGGVWGATFGVGVTTAVLSSIMNNMPTVLVGALGIEGAHVAPAIREAMVYANVIGCDLGPKFTPIGSLATLLWLHVLAQKGVRIGWGYYFRVGVLLTTPILLVTLAALALRLTLADGQG
jgi:arsenical pump membrane protein